MSIQQRVVLRYRSSGHARFDLPAMLCEPETGEQLVAGLQGAKGVYRVDLHRRKRKLSLRYAEGVTDFREIAAALSMLVAEIANHCGSQILSRQSAEKSPGTGGWVKTKIQRLQHDVAAAGLACRNAVRQNFTMSAGQKKFLAEFLTDVLVLYLIKAHWHLITQHWLKRPWQYRYEWMAALYMIYLLVSSKKPKP